MQGENVCESVFCGKMLLRADDRDAGGELIPAGLCAELKQIAQQYERLAALTEHILCDGQIERALAQHLGAAGRHIVCDDADAAGAACGANRIDAGRDRTAM